MKCLFCLAVFAALWFVAPAKGSELFPFVISFDAPDNITNISQRLDAPAGKDGFVRVVDGHFANDKGRIRFWGTNTCFDGNFQDKETADRMADRLARFGTNCVRLHHMDSHNIWGGSNTKTKMTLDPDALDKLDYYVAALKKRGIYVNLNLHVSRMLDERDGFPPVANRPSHDKGIDNYYRPLIDANKKYAKDLLEHVNPYTGKTYKDEPAVAMIEINNENSILNTWGGWGDLAQIQDPFLADLRKQWNEWLVAKYKDDAGLRKAWRARSEPLGSEMLKNGNFDDGYVPDYNGWNWETDAKTNAPISNADGALRMDVKQKGEVAWHPQLTGSGFAVKKGQLYTLIFRVKANKETSINVGLRMNHEPWEGLGFDTTATLSTDWVNFMTTLTPSQDDDNARVTFGGLQEGIVYELDYVSLMPGGEVDLPLVANPTTPTPPQEGNVPNSTLPQGGYSPSVEGWNFAQQNGGVVPVIWKKDAGQYPQEAVDDFIDFLFDVEAKYWDEMYRFLKEEIKVKQPVSGTQVEYGSIHAQAKMDYCDYHAYWNHPVFPHRPWDMNDWYVSNRALVNHLDREILGPAATKRVYGKPFTVSEYNHPAPNQYAAEGLPLLAAFGAFQDWDGFFPFAYSHSRDAEPKMITSFFDTSGNTVQMAHMIACKMLFDTKLNIPTMVAPLTAEKEREIYKKDRHQYNIGFAGLGLSPSYALTRRTAIDVSGRDSEPMGSMLIPHYEQDKWVIPFFQDLSEETFASSGLFYKDENGGGANVCTPRGGLFTGFIQEGFKPFLAYQGEGVGTTLQFDEKPNLGWATATLTRLDDEKGNTERYLFVITGETRNTDMVLESLEGDRITVGNRWGKPPVLCEGVAVQMLWGNVKPGQLRCWALDESGNRRVEVVVDRENIQMGPQYKTIWYEIEVTEPQS
ncbi:MAG: carbohydrate binding domain-containing protein [Planctomycetaceae bacterium]|jgi:hypothetical protein|nr:carbohydrate binding domain-containing protein [Planctomycetaceae bacterium]